MNPTFDPTAPLADAFLNVIHSLQLGLTLMIAAGILLVLIQCLWQDRASYRRRLPRLDAPEPRPRWQRRY